MKVLVFGTTGQVAGELSRAGVDLVALDRSQADLCDPAACAVAIERSAADVVINAAAYTAVDRAETDVDTAFRVNSEAPAAMARAAAIRHLPFVHISTDYVFDGSGEKPWVEEDETCPLGVYGRSKRDGERGIEAAGGVYAILRTSWVVSARGNNFVKTMLRLGRERDTISVVEDQVGGPTPARDIAGCCLSVAADLHAGRGASGIYHYAGSPDVSWADFATSIFQMAGLPTKVLRIDTSKYPTPAKRPANSRLDCSRLKDVFGIERPDWRMGLSDILLELKAM